MHATKTDLTDISPLQTKLFDYFDLLEINHETYSHPAIMTVEEGKDLKKTIPGAGGKSLFLTNKKGEYWLIIAKDDTIVDLKGLSKHLKTKRFSFGKPDKMLEILSVTPGSVTPFGLLNDRHKTITVVIDQRLTEEALVTFHPLKNDKSTVISSDDLIKFIVSLGHKHSILSLDQFAETS